MSLFKKSKKTEKTISTPVDEIVSLSTNDFEIESQEDRFKADGAVVIGTKNSDNTYTQTSNTLPSKIDIEARKKAILDAQNSKKKKATLTDSKQTKIVETVVALIVLLLFGAVYGVFYYYKNIANNKDFTVKKVHVEYGSPISLKIEDYVNIANPDEKMFTLDLSDFVPDLVGEYKYKITHEGVTKMGIIEVSDTLAPEVEVKKVTINPGETYTPEMFIDSCKDLNSCIATFEDGTTIKTAKEFGESNIYLVIKDSFGNQITKQTILVTKTTNISYLCTRIYDYDYNTGYRLTQTYDITFDKDDNYLNSKVINSYEYIDNNDYLRFKEGHPQSSYIYDDSLSKVTHTQDNSGDFGGNRNYINIRNYLNNSSYVCIRKTDEK